MFQLLELPHALLTAVLFFLPPYCLERLGETCKHLKLSAREDAFWIILLKKRWPEFFASNAIPEPRWLFARMLGATSPTPPQAWPVDPSGVRILLEITNMPDGSVLRLSYRLSELEFCDDVVVFEYPENNTQAYVLPIPVEGDNAWWFTANPLLAIGKRMKVTLLTDEYRVLQGELARWNEEHVNQFRISPSPQEARRAASHAMRTGRKVEECWLSFDLIDQRPHDDADFRESVVNAEGNVHLAMTFERQLVAYASMKEPFCPNEWDWPLDALLTADILGELRWQ